MREQGGWGGVKAGCEWQADKQRKGWKKKRSNDSGEAEGVIKMESDREKGRPIPHPRHLPALHSHISRRAARSNPGPLITIKLHLLLKHIHFII